MVRPIWVGLGVQTLVDAVPETNGTIFYKLELKKWARPGLFNFYFCLFLNCIAHKITVMY